MPLTAKHLKLRKGLNAMLESAETFENPRSNCCVSPKKFLLHGFKAWKHTVTKSDKTQRNKTNKPQKHDWLFSHSQTPGLQGSISDSKGQGAMDWTSGESSKMISSPVREFLYPEAPGCHSSPSTELLWWVKFHTGLRGEIRKRETWSYLDFKPQCWQHILLWEILPYFPDLKNI